MKKTMLATCLSCLLVLFATHALAAAGGNMPWEGPLQRILTSFQGPVAKVIGVIAIIATGLGMAFGEGGGGMKKMLSIVFGLSIAFTAASIAVDWFGMTEGLGF